MKYKKLQSNFNFEYAGSNSTEAEIIEKGYLQLTGKELLLRISNKTVYGDYPPYYKFKADVYQNGTTEGINNVGTQDFGKWIIDFEKNTLQLVWQNGWLDTITHAYEVKGNIEFYDVDSGNWRTTFKKIMSLNE